MRVYLKKSQTEIKNILDQSTTQANLFYKMEKDAFNFQINDKVEAQQQPAIHPKSVQIAIDTPLKIKSHFDDPQNVLQQIDFEPKPIKPIVVDLPALTPIFEQIQVQKSQSRFMATLTKNKGEDPRKFYNEMAKFFNF